MDKSASFVVDATARRSTSSFGGNMNVQPPMSVPDTAIPSANPHILWRQVLGLVFWAGVLSLAAGGPIGAILSLALGGATFADAWTSGIYKRPARMASSIFPLWDGASPRVDDWDKAASFGVGAFRIAQPHR